LSDGCEKRPPEVGVAVVLRDLELLLLPHLIVELKDELPEDEGAHIEGENVQEPPVPEHEPVSDVIENVTDSILVSQPPLDHLTQGARTEDEHQVVDDAGPRQDDQQDQPEPDEHKDLLVDRVYRQHAESIVGLYCPRGAKLLINAFGHPGEHSALWIKPVPRANN